MPVTGSFSSVAAAAADEVLASSIKADGNPNAEFTKFVARLHAQQLR